VIARPIAIRLSETLGPPVVSENRGGANGLIAGEAVAKAQPDGYTFLVAATNTHIFATLLYDKVNYDPVKDFAPITKFDVSPNVLVAAMSFPAKTIKELVAYGKANPGKILWASSGNGSGGHLGLVQFADEAGIKVLHVPYKGAGPAITGTLTGDNNMVFVNTAVAMPHLKANRLRALGFAGMKRLPTLPDLPTFDESGFPGFESTNFKGLMAPAGTARAIITKLHAELVKIVQSPETVARMTAAGSIPIGNTPEQFAEENRKETAKWAKIIKTHGIKAD
jgi:tripartite-type tricarboxylate transporter receptor subunit TctC